jgi:hypothetical protein
MTSFPHTSDGPAIRTPIRRHVPTDSTVDPRTSPLEWIRTRRAEREVKRAEAAHVRAAHRLEALGYNWRVLDLQATAGSDRMSFLAVGPGGIFAVTVKDHGRSRVAFAGDVVQVAGRRPKYVQEARKNAKLAATALTRIAGVSVPVMPVLAFAGRGTIAVHGMPKGVIVSAYQELGRVLNARGQRLAPETVEKLYALAADPATWLNPPYVPLADRYRWYPDGDGATEKRPTDKETSAG